MPPGSPLVSLFVRRAFPKLMPTRSLPVGASSESSSIGIHPDRVCLSGTCRRGTFVVGSCRTCEVGFRLDSRQQTPLFTARTQDYADSRLDILNVQPCAV